MKRFILAAGACALAFASILPSFAADMPCGRYAEPAPSYFSWSGFYVGLNGGYGWGTSNWSSDVTAGSADPAGGLFGGTVGFNVQNWGLVFGVGGDLAGNWMRNNTSSGTGICAVPGCTVQTSWFGTARGRVGYAFDRAFVLRHGGRRLRRCSDDGRRRNCDGRASRLDCRCGS